MFTIPNLLTYARFLLVPWFLWVSMRGMYVTAFVIFIVAAGTDSLDGFLARRLNMRSKLGAILDPIADKTLMACSFIYYTFANVPAPIPGWLTFTVFIRDFLILLTAWLMSTRVPMTVFPPTVFGKASTVLQAVTLGTAIAVNGFLPAAQPLADVLFQVTMLVTISSGWHYARRAERILNELAPVRA